MRSVRNLLCFVLGFVLIAAFELAHAETTSATSGYTDIVPKSTNRWYTQAKTTAGVSVVVGQRAGTQNCSAAIGQHSPVYSYTITTSVFSPPDNSQCTFGAGPYKSESSTDFLTSYGTCSSSQVDLGNSTCGTLTYTCPANQNWTLSGSTCTRPDCASGEVRNPDTGVCSVPPCVAGNVVLDGFFDIGTNPSSPPPSSPCVNGCYTTPDGVSPERQALVNGVMHYYAHMTYTSTTSQCSPNTNLDALTSVPANTCAQNQAMGQVNGRTVCVDQVTGQQQKSPPIQTETKTKDKVTNPDGSTVVTETTYNNETHITTTTTTTTNAAGDVTGQNTTKQADPGYEPASDKQKPKTYCEQNPTSPKCTGTGSQVGTSGLYKEGTKTVGGVVGKFKDDVMAAPAIAAAMGFFNVSIPSGACDGFSGTTSLFGHSITVDMTDVFCGGQSSTLYHLLSLGLQLMAAFVAFRWAFL